MNANGVEVVSLLLSIEPDGFDRTIRDFVETNGFDQGGVDCILEGSEREQVREGFSYYTGLPSSSVPRSSAQRRAFVILNGVTDSASHDPWELLYVSQSYGSGVKDEVLGHINAIMPGGTSGVTFASWAADNELPESAMPIGDADGDGLSNGIEFYLGTSPVTITAQPLTIARLDEAQVSLNYPLGQDREGVTVQLEGSDDLTEWRVVDVPAEKWVITPGEGEDAAVISVPSESFGFLRLSVTLE